MTKEEQINEVAIILCKTDKMGCCGECETCIFDTYGENSCKFGEMAEALYEKDYRKKEESAVYLIPKGFIEFTTNEGNKISILATEITSVSTIDSASEPEKVPNCKGMIGLRGEYSANAVQESYEEIMTKIAEALIR